MPGDFVFTKATGFRTTFVRLAVIVFDSAQDMVKQLPFGSSFHTHPSNFNAFENDVFLDTDPQNFEHFCTEILDVLRCTNDVTPKINRGIETFATGTDALL